MKKIILLLLFMLIEKPMGIYAEMTECNGIWTNKKCKHSIKDKLYEKEELSYPGQPSQAKTMIYGCILNKKEQKVGDKWTEGIRDCECFKFESGEKYTECKVTFTDRK